MNMLRCFFVAHLRYFKEVLIFRSPVPSAWRTHVFLNVNQCNYKDTESAVVTLIAAMSGAPDTVCRWVFIVFARPPMQYQSSWDYVSSDLCAEMSCADTEPALPAKQRCNMSHRCPWWRTWKCDGERSFRRRRNAAPPERAKKAPCHFVRRSYVYGERALS